MDKAMYLQTLSLYPKIAWFARKTALGRWMFVSQRTDKDGLGLMMAVSPLYNLLRRRLDLLIPGDPSNHPGAHYIYCQ